jgi:hypothetical protein
MNAHAIHPLPAFVPAVRGARELIVRHVFPRKGSGMGQTPRHARPRQGRRARTQCGESRPHCPLLFCRPSNPSPRGLCYVQSSHSSRTPTSRRQHRRDSGWPSVSATWLRPLPHFLLRAPLAHVPSALLSSPTTLIARPRPAPRHRKPTFTQLLSPLIICANSLDTARVAPRPTDLPPFCRRPLSCRPARRRIDSPNPSLTAVPLALAASDHLPHSATSHTHPHNHGGVPLPPSPPTQHNRPCLLPFSRPHPHHDDRLPSVHRRVV